MANLEIRYFTKRVGKSGTRNFWQPNKALRKKGWKLARLSDDDAIAIGEAQEWNRKLDEWRGLVAAATPAADPVAAAAAAVVAKIKVPKPSTPAQLGTIAAMIEGYKADEDYTGLKPKTRTSYDYCLGLISRWSGDGPVIAVDGDRAVKFYRELRKVTPATANAVVRMGRTLWKFGERRKLARDNPWRLVKIKGLKKTARIWSPEAIAWYVETADLVGMYSLGTAVAINEWLGQREGDVIAFTRTMRRADGLYFDQGKGGRAMALPVQVVPELTARLDAELERSNRRKVAATTILADEATGQPYDEHRFRHAFAEIRAIAAERARFAGELEIAGELELVMFKHLRHTAVTRLAEAGATPLEIAAITGHTIASVNTILEHYLVRTKKMAGNAFKKRLAADAAELDELAEGGE